MPRSLPATHHFEGARLRAFRESLGEKREHVAVRVPCSVSLLTAIELGYTVPSVDKAATVCAAYGCRLDDVIVPVEEYEQVAK